MGKEKRERSRPAPGIRDQFVGLFLLLIILPFIFLMFITIHLMYNYTCRIYGNYMMTNLELSQEQLTGIYNTYRDVSMSLYLNQTVNLLDDSSEDETERMVRDQIENFWMANPSLAFVWVETDDFTCSAGSVNAKAVEFVRNNREYLKAQKGRVIWFPKGFYFTYPQGTYKYVIARSLNTADTVNVGFFMMTVDKQVFDKAFSLIGLEQSEVYLVDTSGIVMYSSETGMLNREFQLFSVPEDAKSGFYTQQIGGRNYLTAYMRSYKTGWTQVAVVPVRSIFLNFKEAGAVMVLVSCIYIMLIIAMVFWVNRHLVHPIISLCSAMDAFAQGELAVSVEEDYGTREINGLASHFNRMTGRVRVLIQDNQRVERQKNQFEMQVLISQMNPHFIYNSLNTVKWLAVINKQVTIQNVVDSLIYLMMQTTNKEHSSHTIEEEVRLLEHYVLIQKLRFMNFHMEFQIGPGTQKLCIRKFLIQPVVENSIIHGFCRGRVSNGVITFNSSIKEGNLCITVTDNGNGFDMNVDGPKEDTEDKHSSIGISNVSQIIKLEYGPDYGLQVESEPGKGTTVTLILPVIEIQGGRR